MAANSFQSRFDTGSDGGSGRRSKFRNSLPCWMRKSRCGPVASRSCNEADALALLDALAGMHQHARQVHVVRRVTIVVLNLDQIARAAFPAGENHTTIADGLHGRAGGRGVINSQVWPVSFRMGWKRCSLKCEVITAANFSGECRKAFFIDFPSGV